MSKAPSDATLLRRYKAAHRRITEERDQAVAAVKEYRARATKAEQEAAEWRKRFDILLTRDQQPNNATPERP